MSRLLEDRPYQIMLACESGERFTVAGAGKVAERLGTTERTVYRELKRLAGKGLLERGDEPGQWRPTQAWYSIRSYEGVGR